MSFYYLNNIRNVSGDISIFLGVIGNKNTLKKQAIAKSSVSWQTRHNFVYFLSLFQTRTSIDLGVGTIGNSKRYFPEKVG